MVNWLVILGTALAGYLVGWLWYGPLFEKQWMKLNGFSKKDMEKSKKEGMAKTYLAGFLATVIMAYVLSMFVKLALAVTFVDGALVGLWLWLGFIATTLFGKVLWENKPFKLYLLDSLHYLVVLAVMGGIFAVWV